MLKYLWVKDMSKQIENFISEMETILKIQIEILELKKW